MMNKASYWGLPNSQQKEKYCTITPQLWPGATLWVYPALRKSDCNLGAPLTESQLHNIIKLKLKAIVAALIYTVCVRGRTSGNETWQPAGDGRRALIAFVWGAV